MNNWNRCNECGKFISYQDFTDGKATHKIFSMMTRSVDGELEHDEMYDTFHHSCRGLSSRNPNEIG